ncbi:MAG: hypothetical protein LBP26_04245 [Clostridiales bacterium]|jgi:hypothetical protein|nr:hypothetical protein [Clostridiales bacterium]
MRTVFTRRQIWILAVVHVITAAMLLGVFFYRPARDGGKPTAANPSDGGTAETPADHDKFRAARILDESVMLETNLGGSGNESVTAAFELSGRLYLFGETDSQNYDFEGRSEGENTFLIITDLALKPLFYKTFKGGFAKCAHFNTAFLLMTKSERAAELFALDASGTAVLQKEIPLETGEVPLDFVYGYDEQSAVTAIDEIVVAVQMNLKSEPQKKIKLIPFDADFKQKTGRIIYNAYALEYIAGFPYGAGYAFAVNMRSDIGSHMALIVCESPLTLPHKLIPYELNSGRDYLAARVTPYSGGFAALIIDADGSADILTVGFDLNAAQIILLPPHKAKSGELFFDDYEGVFYVYTRSQTDLGRFIEVNPDGPRTTAYDTFSTCRSLTAYRAARGAAYFGCKNMPSPYVAVRYGAGRFSEFAFGGKSENIAELIPFPVDGYIIAVCTSAAKNSKVGGNFGGDDIWLVKIRYE